METVLKIIVAEMERFELSNELPRCRVSNAVPSTTQPHLQYTSYCRTPWLRVCRLGLLKKNFGVKAKQFAFTPLSHISKVHETLAFFCIFDKNCYTVEVK